MKDDAMVIDGHEVFFLAEPAEVSGSGDSFRVVGEDQELVGYLSFGRDRTELVVRDRDGKPLMEPSPWGGAIRARFASRDLAVRALLARR